MSENSILFLLQRAFDFLHKKKIPQARLDAEIILADILKIPRIKLYVQFEQNLNEKQKQEYRDKIIERSKNKPTAYIIEKKEFFHSSFFVNQDVLIPRPETEELIELFVNQKKSMKASNCVILDLCCGSGCIGISLKQEFKNSQIFFLDISQKALEIAQINAKNLLPSSQEDLFFICSNLYDKLDGQKFDFIFCNPPYVLEDEKNTLSLDVFNHEPHIALFVKKPEFFFKNLLKKGFQYLKENGEIFLEINPKLAKMILDFTTDYTRSQIILDQSKKERFLYLKK